WRAFPTFDVGFRMRLSDVELSDTQSAIGNCICRKGDQMWNTRFSGRRRIPGVGMPHRGAIVAIALVLSVVSTGVILGQRTEPSSQVSRKTEPSRPDAG